MLSLAERPVSLSAAHAIEALRTIGGDELKQQPAAAVGKRNDPGLNRVFEEAWPDE